MISSMTGYGQGVHISGNFEISVEVKSVNNRYLDVSLKLPRILSLYEQKARELVGTFVNRGRVSIWMNIKNNGEQSQSFSVNHAMLQAYLSLVGEVKDKHGLSGELTLEQALALPDVITIETEKANEAVWACAKSALEMAMKELVVMRNREGEEMEKDFVERLNFLADYVAQVEKLSAKGPQEELDKLKERAKRLVNNEQLDEYRLELELAIISDRIDVSEECTRFNSHITLFREMLADSTSQGRQLNFLLQEMNREANTMASKAYTAEISHTVVKIKEEIEKIREQVQNIE
jgi:uncharacterized protein (TIGR00255 family)